MESPIAYKSPAGQDPEAPERQMSLKRPATGREELCRWSDPLQAENPAGRILFVLILAKNVMFLEKLLLPEQVKIWHYLIKCVKCFTIQRK